MNLRARTSRVLLYDGEELVGAKQNRILNVSVLVEAKSALTIPVSCVEQGRWSRRSEHFGTAPHISHAELRRRKAETQAARPLARGVAQGEVWDAVRDKSLRMSVSSSTGAASPTLSDSPSRSRLSGPAFSGPPVSMPARRSSALTRASSVRGLNGFVR